MAFCINRRHREIINIRRQRSIWSYSMRYRDEKHCSPKDRRSESKREKWVWAQQ